MELPIPLSPPRYSRRSDDYYLLRQLLATATVQICIHCHGDSLMHAMRMYARTLDNQVAFTHTLRLKRMETYAHESTHQFCTLTHAHTVTGAHANNRARTQGLSNARRQKALKLTRVSDVHCLVSCPSCYRVRSHLHMTECCMIAESFFLL